MEGGPSIERPLEELEPLGGMAGFGAPPPQAPPAGSVLLFLETESNPTHRVRTLVAGGLKRLPSLPSLARVPREDALRAGGRTSYLTWLVALLCCGIWAFVGLILWLPVALGSVLHVSLALLQAMLEDRTPLGVAGDVRRAASFYLRGFEAALDVAGPSHLAEPLAEEQPAPVAPPTDGPRLLKAAGWALLGWYPLLMLVGMLDWPHVEAWKLLGGRTGRVVEFFGTGIAGAMADLRGLLP